MLPQRYFLNVFLSAYGRKWINDFALPKTKLSMTKGTLYIAEARVKNYFV